MEGSSRSFKRMVEMLSARYPGTVPWGGKSGLAPAVTVSSRPNYVMSSQG